MAGSLTGFVTSIAVRILAGGTVKAGAWVQRRLRLTQTPSTGSTVIMWLLQSGTIITILYYLSQGALSFQRAVVLMFVLSSLALSTYAWPLFRIKAVGVIGADFRISDGLDYRRSLSMCRDGLAFLGIGAAKLTGEAEFERAVLRCQATKPVRLLLCDPDSQALTDSAMRAGKDREEYRQRVRESLRRIANLKTHRAASIEVRFYSDRPETFRLMFIDDRLCLVSYNALGEGDGSQLPQLHVRAYEDKRRVSTFYWAFDLYFSRLWEFSAVWDFKKHLT